MAALLATVATAWAQDTSLTVDAQLRARGEHDNGVINPQKEGEQSANYVSERARLSFDFKRNNLELKASVQHTGLWGQDPMNQSNGRATMSEAWAKLTFADVFFAQVGRQQLCYDDERILGANDWSLDGNWHDALKVGYEDGHHRLHAILAMNQTAEHNKGDYYDGPMPYKNLMALWYHYQAEMVPLGISLIGLNIGQERGTSGHGRTNYLQTFGTDVSFRPLSWYIHGSFYYQMGKTTVRKVQSWMASGDAGVSICPQLQLRAGYDYMPANDYDKDSWNAFIPLFGSQHNFLGAMDYFTSSLSCGLQDIHGGVSSQICDGLKADVDYHYLMTVQKLPDLDKQVGHEIDVKVTARLMKDVTLSAGYSTMLGTATLDRLKGGSHKAWQDWGWLQLNVNPRVLTALLR